MSCPPFATSARNAACVALMVADVGERLTPLSADLDISFADALAETANVRRHLLIGNGFSIAAHKGFAYDRLFDEARRYSPGIAALFEGHGADFEKALSTAAPDDKIKIRKAFMAALAKVHPRRNYLTPEQRTACSHLLEEFAGLVRGELRGRVFTTNYDLLLYWVLMHRQSNLKMYDGFDSDCVWSAARASNTFVHYLHGAVHHFETEIGVVRSEMQQWKLRWREGASLIEQVRIELNGGRFPVFVSEGSSAEKRHRIRHNIYLKTSRKAFAGACNEVGSALLTIGHSLGAVDEHITDLICDGSAAVYIGVYNDRDRDRAAEIFNYWAKRRSEAQKPPLRVRLFRSADCQIWGP